MMADVSIRPARPDEAAALASFARASFVAAFADQNNPADMDAYVTAAFSDAQIGRELADPSNTFLLAFLPDRAAPAGYAKLRSGTPDPSVRGALPVELERLYVEPQRIGHGLGGALMQATLDEATTRGYQTLWLGVWEHNLRARAFYERWGFARVGSHVFRLGTDDQTDLIMERSASRGAPMR